MPKDTLLKIFLFSFNFFVLSLIFLLFLWRDNTKNGKIIKSVNLGITFLLVILFIQYALYADIKYIEPNWIKVERLVIKNKNITGGLNKLRIVQISDLHISNNGFRERSLVKKVNILKPDIILITGDFLNQKEDLPLVISLLSKLKSQRGIYGILGDADQDTFMNETDKMAFKTTFKNAGVNILDNENIRIPVNEKEGIWITTYTTGVNLGEFKILLVHDLDRVNLQGLTHRNADLVLAGDTHGGQIGLSSVRRLSDSVDEHKYMSGLYRIDEIPIYVNRGIGMSKRNIRFLCRPEITLITLSVIPGHDI